MPCRASSSWVWVYSREVTTTSCPRSRRRSMIGRSTSTCAGALMSAQILMRRDSAARRRRDGSDRGSRELRGERVTLHQCARALQERVLLCLEVLTERGHDDLSDLPQVVLDQPAGCERRGPDPKARGVHRRAGRGG